MIAVIVTSARLRMRTSFSRDDTIAAPPLKAPAVNVRRPGVDAAAP